MPTEYLAVLALLHEVGKGLVDWFQQGVDLLAILTAPEGQQHSVTVRQGP